MHFVFLKNKLPKWSHFALHLIYLPIRSVPLPVPKPMQMLARSSSLPMHSAHAFGVLLS